MANILMVIVPYWYQGTWVFDDESVGLNKEPFVAGVPEMIDDLVKDIPNARGGFRQQRHSALMRDYRRLEKRHRWRGLVSNWLAIFADAVFCQVNSVS